MKFRHALIFLILLLAGQICRADESARAVLAELNYARTHPHEYAQLLAAQPGGFPARDVREAIDFLNHARPVQPLAYSDGLSMSAMLHVMGQGATGDMGHRGADSSSPWDRIGRFGKWFGTVGENISYGMTDARGIVMSLIVDAGVGNRGHRKNIFCSKFGVAGVACGSHARWGAMCVIDFAGGFVENRTAMLKKQPATPQPFLYNQG